MAVAALLSLQLLPSPARSAPATYSFTGTVNQVGTTPTIPVTPGQVIPISIQVDTAASASPPGSGHYASVGSFNPGSGLFSIIQSALFAGQDLSSLVQTIDVTGTSISFVTAGPQISAGFQLALSDAPSGTFSPGALPSTLDPGLFTGGTFTVVEAFSAATFGYSGTINGLAVPEPASLGLVGIGLLGLLASKQRGSLTMHRGHRRQLPT